MKIVNWMVYALIRSFLIMGRFLPMAPTFLLCRVLAALVYPMMKNRRALMLFNLERALGDDTTAEERERIARESFLHLLYSFGELFHMDKIYANWQNHFEWEGDEIVERYVKEGRGFFVFGGHFGGWTMQAAPVYRYPDLPGVNMVARPLRNPKMQELFEFVIGKFGGKFISTRGTGKTIVDAAARGELIGLYMDQESRRGQGVFVKFFGMDASSHVVPGYLAWKNDIPMIPYWIPRKAPGQFKIVFRMPLQYTLTDDVDENNRMMAQLIASEVERAIREHPEQWLWAHNRWRRRPDGTKIEVFEKKKRKSRSRARKSGEYLSSLDVAKKNAERQEQSDKE